MKKTLAVLAMVVVGLSLALAPIFAQTGGNLPRPKGSMPKTPGCDPRIQGKSYLQGAAINVVNLLQSLVNNPSTFQDNKSGDVKIIIPGFDPNSAEGGCGCICPGAPGNPSCSCNPPGCGNCSGC